MYIKITYAHYKTKVTHCRKVGKYRDKKKFKCPETSPPKVDHSHHFSEHPSRDISLCICTYIHKCIQFYMN